MTTEKKKEYVYKSTLRDTYGLTPSMIEELEPPDKLVPNPYYTTGYPASLFLIERVEVWVDENQDRLQKARISRARRSQAAKKVHEKNQTVERSRAIEWIDKTEIELEPLPDDLIETAKRHYILRETVDLMTEKGVKAYVRHHCSNYNKLLQEIYQYDGWLSEELYQRLRKRIDTLVDQAIAEWSKANGALLNV